MAFIDERTLHLKAGDGGGGIVAWLHEKGKEFGGPAGGDGGRGGNVYLRAVRDINKLSDYRQRKVFEAKRGGDGGGKGKHGANGADLILELPLGSVVTNTQSRKAIELLEEDMTLVLLEGGRGGFGNEHFKSSINIRPTRVTAGKQGEEGDFHIELKLIADAGLIGLPNAGKSSLLNALTRAHARVGSWAFTTLEPNLGAFHEFILADIPGLIEGASEGRGLGVKFFRHIERTQVLLHCISLEESDPVHSYRTVRTELAKHHQALGEKEEIIVLTKADIVPDSRKKSVVRAFKHMKKRLFAVSVNLPDSVKEFGDGLVKLLRERYY